MVLLQDQGNGERRSLARGIERSGTIATRPEGAVQNMGGAFVSWR